jgi:hypothetical protein
MMRFGWTWLNGSDQVIVSGSQDYHEHCDTRPGDLAAMERDQAEGVWGYRVDVGPWAETR